MRPARMVALPANAVVLLAGHHTGRGLGVVTEPHDGTPDGIRRAAGVAPVEKVTIVQSPPLAMTNQFYTANRAPLAPSPLG